MRAQILFIMCVLVQLMIEKAKCLLVLNSKTKVVNLAYDLVEDETIQWPTALPFDLTVSFKGYNDAGVYLEANDFCMSEHGGTHMDSPVHYGKGKMTTHEIPIDQLIGEAVLVDVSKKVGNNADYQASLEDFKTWERQHGQIPTQSILLLYTGWSRYYPDKKTYLGTETKNTSMLHFPGLHPAATKWLVDKRRIKAFGLDTASLDYGQSRFSETHRILFEQNIPGLENLANLDKLPPRGFFIIGLPLRIRGGSGAPMGIVALLDESVNSESNSHETRKEILLAALLVVVINVH